MAKSIEVNQKNVKTVTVTITSGLASLSGYTASFTVKDKSGTTKFTATGSVNGLVITYTLTATHNDLDVGTYEYEPTVTDGTNNYTLVDEPGEYIVKRSIVF